jgi:hypothetical protein
MSNLHSQAILSRVAAQSDFAVDLGDFGCQTTREMHDGQLEALKHHVQVFGQLKGPQKGSGIHDQSL